MYPQTTTDTNYSVSGFFGGTNTPGFIKYQEGKATGKWTDLNDFLAKGGQVDGSAGSYVDRIIKTQKDKIKQETSFLDKYTKTNPFAFDESLAKKSATAEYEPYYTELLNDYLANVDLQRKTVQDDKTLLSTLKNLDQQQSSIAYNQAVGKAEEGFAGSGLFFSGIKDRALGTAEVSQKMKNEGTAAQYANKESTLANQEAGINLGVNQQTRDIGRQQEEAVQSGILQRKNEAQTQYYTPLIQSYNRRFGGGTSGDVLSGYLPPDFLRY